MKRRFLSQILFLLALTASVPLLAQAAPTVSANIAGPTLIKPSLYVRARRMVRYWKFPEQDNYWSWIPEVGFQVIGPVESGSQFYVEFTTPDGKPWTTLKCNLPDNQGQAILGFGTEQEGGHQDKRALLATGVFGFTIKLKNALEGTDTVFYKGRFKVNKFHVGNELPAFKNQFEYYVDQDWQLPIGYLWLDALSDQNAPPLNVSLWIRGTTDDTKIAAYVFYNGKSIGSTKGETGSAGRDFSILTSGNDEEPRWERWRFRWGTVRGYNVDTSGNRYEGHFLNRNPGQYEIKVLRNGKLVRTAQFTVEANGQIADNGWATQNQLGLPILLLPVKVLGDQDGMWDAAAWKTEAFYGNPLTGFNILSEDSTSHSLWDGWWRNRVLSLHFASY